MLRKYSLTEQASNARNGIYGKRWPSTSPKRLVVEFSNQEEVLHFQFPGIYFCAMILLTLREEIHLPKFSNL